MASEGMPFRDDWACRYPADVSSRSMPTRRPSRDPSKMWFICLIDQDPRDFLKAYANQMASSLLNEKENWRGLWFASYAYVVYGLCCILYGLRELEVWIKLHSYRFVIEALFTLIAVILLKPKEATSQIPYAHYFLSI